MDNGQILTTLLLCGLMGLIGQGARAVIGLKTMTMAAMIAPSQQTEFNAAYMIVSLMIGFIAGVLAGFAIGLTTAHFSDPKVLGAVAVAGYAGSDFIENALSIIIPGAGKGGAQQPDTGAGTTSGVTAHLQALSSRISTVASGVSAIQTRLGTGAAAVVVPALAAAFSSCAPRVNADIWVPVLNAAFDKYGLTNNKRIAAAIGQFLVEAGDDFRELVENLRYKTAAHIHAIFPNEFPTVASAEPYVNNPVGLANRAYANKNGNGDEASGDGYRFCGRGLIQLTGRNDYAKFGATLGMTADQAAQYCATPAGAAMSGCWYLQSKGCLPLADAWLISKITRLVNGAAMLRNNDRIAYSNAFLDSLGS